MKSLSLSVLFWGDSSISAMYGFQSISPFCVFGLPNSYVEHEFCFLLSNTESTSGPFVQLVTFSKVFIGTVAKAGCTKLRKLSAVNRTNFLTSMHTATTRISGVHLIIMDSASAKEPVTM